MAPRRVGVCVCVCVCVCVKRQSHTADQQYLFLRDAIQVTDTGDNIFKRCRAGAIVMPAVGAVVALVVNNPFFGGGPRTLEAAGRRGSTGARGGGVLRDSGAGNGGTVEADARHHGSGAPIWRPRQIVDVVYGCVQLVGGDDGDFTRSCEFISVKTVG